MFGDKIKMSLRLSNKAGVYDHPVRKYSNVRNLAAFSGKKNFESNASPDSNFSKVHAPNFAALFLFLLLVGCVSNPPESLKEYSADLFSISYPASWSVMNSSGSVLFLSPKKTNVMVQVISDIRPARTLDEYVEISKEQMSAKALSKQSNVVVKSVDPISDTNVTVQGVTGRRLTFLIYLNQNDIRKEITYLYKDGRLYALVFTALEQLYAEERKQTEPILESFRFK